MADLASSIDALLGIGDSAPPAETPAAEAPKAEATPAEPPKASDPPPVPKPAEKEEEKKPEEAAAPAEAEAEAPAEEEAKPAEEPVAESEAPAEDKPVGQTYKAKFEELESALGEPPDAEKIREYMGAYSDQLAMEHDFTSGDPVAIQKFVSHWNEVSPEGMQQLAASLPNLLASQKNPEAYSALAEPVLGRYSQALYDRANAETDADKKASYLHAARMIDWDLNGSYRENPAEEPKQPKLSAREQQVEKGLREIQEFKRQQASAAVDSFTHGVVTDSQQQFLAAIDNALKPGAGLVNQRLFNAAKKDFIQEVTAAMAGEKEAVRLFDLQALNAQRSPSKEAHDALVSNYMTRAQRAIRNLAPAALKDLGVSAKEKSTAAHKAASASATAGAQPAASTGAVPAPAKFDSTKFSSKSDAMEAHIDALLGVR